MKFQGQEGNCNKVALHGEPDRARRLALDFSVIVLFMLSFNVINDVI